VTHVPTAGDVIRSKWTLDQYREMLTSLLDRSLTPLDIDGFARRAPGFWLRHDVELSLDAAIAMADVETALDIPSSYFVCVESPYFASEAAVNAAVDQLSRLGRDVSYHLVLSSSAPPIGDRLRALATRFPSVHPRALTFHAPRIPAADLAEEPMGETVYEPLVEDIGRYFSDSTGRWRWGHPVHADLANTDLVQILTHPFWWSGRYEPAEVASAHAAAFLPQLAAAPPAAGSVAPHRPSH
jgi:hypothetical protein